MRSEQFYQVRRADWEALTRLLDRAQGGMPRLDPDDIEALGRLYRAATSDLALAQRDFPGQRLTEYLNQLVARAHASVYRGEPLALRRLWRFARCGFPRLYRRTLPFTLAAAALMLLPALVAGVSTALAPQSARWLLPPQYQQVIPRIEDRDLWVHIPIGERPYASTFIMTNNIQVAFAAFAGGALAGLLTVYALITNGLILGGITGLTIHYSVGLELWSFVIGHGVIELSVITIAGGSGLMLGWAILRPGLYRRRDALTLAARQAVRLLIGCVPLLIVAGAIEGFFSPAGFIPWPVKWALGLGSGAALYGYLLRAGRRGK